MIARKVLLTPLHPRPASFAGVVAVFLAGAATLVDWSTWIELNVSVVYSVPLVFAAAARNRRLLWGLTLLLVCMTFAVYSMQIAPHVFSLSEPFFIDRVLAAVTMAVTASILDAWTHALDIVDVRDRLLKEQNERLEAVNRELVLREEEITRQNEELDRSRRKVEEISGSKTRILAAMSHDIRTPMQAIEMMAEVMSRTAGNLDQAHQIPSLARRLRANAQSVVDLLSEVIDISSFDLGRIVVNDSEFSLDELLAEQRRRLLPLSEEKAIRLEYETSKAGLRLRTDQLKLARILSNLMSNAIKFTDSGAVTVAAGLTPEGTVIIQVRDTGRGIKPEDLDRIFDEFTQLHSPARNPNRGWGLGLSISRRLIQLLGGEITIESALNKGSVFTVSLPSSCIASPEHARPDEQ